MHLILRALLTLLLFFSCTSASNSSSSDLSSDFYSLTCPNVQLFVRNTVCFYSANDGTVSGKLLRLIFHDCMVEGCDASVLIQGNGTERTDPANLSLGGFDVVESAKGLIEVMCPGTVSCADILVLAARDAVEITGGPLVQVPLDRKDGKVSLASNVRPNIIDTSFSVEEMAKTFSSKGLSMEDLVVLSDGIYPSWATFVKSITLPQTPKHQLFAMHQEATRKDVERAFGVLQARFAIISSLTRMWDKETIGDIMRACVIMHNMIVEDERAEYASNRNFNHTYDQARFSVSRPEVSRVHLAEYQEYLRNHTKIRNRSTNQQLQADLVEEIWNRFEGVDAA